MRRFFVLAVLTGLVLTLGCGKGSGVVDPKDVPIKPKDNPTGAAPGDKEKDKGMSAPPVEP